MASSTPLLSPHVDLRNTFGAIFIGIVFAAVLFGAVIVQAFVYFQTHRNTGMTFFKLIVLYLWMLDALHMTFIVHFVYYYLVTSYANLEALTEIVWSAKLQNLLAILIVWSIHVLYAYRIWIVSRGRSKALPIAVGIIVILDLGVGFVTAWEVYHCHQFSDLLGMQWSSLLCLSMIGFTDFVIASSLVYLLATSRTGFSSTDSFLTKLMVYTINTGCLTSMCSIAAMITCAVMPSYFVYMCIEFVATKLYTNSFIALMNARHYQHPYTNTAEFHIHGGVYQPDLHASKESEDEKLHTPQANVYKCSHDEELHPTRPVQVAMVPIEARMEMISASESSV